MTVPMHTFTQQTRGRRYICVGLSGKLPRVRISEIVDQVPSSMSLLILIALLVQMTSPMGLVLSVVLRETARGKLEETATTWKLLQRHMQASTVYNKRRLPRGDVSTQRLLLWSAEIRAPRAMFATRKSVTGDVTSGGNLSMGHVSEEFGLAAKLCILNCPYVFQ
mmetsp:Transcript_12152/g.19754  ORF Transcript_12152/g.19754 Transcript_12152/m.19754 type:complete len:165 (-) Transcript_12152:630-1124(-)